MAKAIKGQEPHVIEDKACPWAFRTFKIKTCLECHIPRCLKDMNQQWRLGYMAGHDEATIHTLREVICGK